MAVAYFTVLFVHLPCRTFKNNKISVMLSDLYNKKACLSSDNGFGSVRISIGLSSRITLRTNLWHASRRFPIPV